MFLHFQLKCTNVVCQTIRVISLSVLIHVQGYSIRKLNFMFVFLRRQKLQRFVELPLEELITILDVTWGSISVFTKAPKSNEKTTGHVLPHSKVQGSTPGRAGKVCGQVGYCDTQTNVPFQSIG